MRVRRADQAAAALSLALASGPALADPASPDLIDCATIPKDADEAALARRFGRAAVKSVVLDAAEGETERGTAIFSATPARRLDVLWSDVARRRRPASVVIRDGSRWRVRLANGATLGLGAGLKEVEAANGRPFAVSGFF